MKRKKVVFAVQPYNAPRSRMIAGALDFATARCRWEIDVEPDCDHFTPESVRRLAASGTAGVLVSKASSWDVVDALAASPMAAVVIDTPDMTVPPPRRGVTFYDGVTLDSWIGELGFSHLAGCGNFRHFGFVPFSEKAAWSENRMTGFARAAQRAGVEWSAFGTSAGPSTLAEWIESLPKPFAVMGANDRSAMEALDACRRAKIEVPSQASLLGVDDNAYMCAISRPTLSSIRIDEEAIGAEIAETLRRMLASGRAGGAMEPPRNMVPSTGHASVVVRDSTRAPLPAAALVRRALDFIHDHAAEGIGTGEVAAHLRVSRRLAELRFRELHTEGLAAAIRRRRLELACGMLRSGNARIGEIATVCGFGGRRPMERLFRERFGVTPGRWRGRHPQR